MSRERQGSIPPSEKPNRTSDNPVAAMILWLMPTEDQPPWRLAVLAFLLCLPLVLFNLAPVNDTAAFYSPMIRELGKGNWAHGFHPMIPPLHMLTGAPFAALGLDGFTAAKLAAALFFALTIFPVFGIVRRFWTTETAVWACLLGMLGCRALRLVGGGLLDCGKMFFLALTVYAICRLWREQGLWVYVTLAVGTAGLALIRGEGVVFSVLAFVCAIGILATHQRLRREGVRLAAAGLLAVLAVVPWMSWEMRATGYPLTDTRQIQYVRKIVNLLGVESRIPQAVMPESFAARLKVVFPAPPSPQQGLPVFPTPTIGSMLLEVWRGFFPPYMPLFVLGIWAAWRRREWRAERRLLLVWVFGHAAILLLILSGAINKRYFTPAVPLLLGWCAAGLMLGMAWLGQWKARWARRLPLVLAVGAGGLLWSGYAELHESKEKQQKARAVRVGGKWLREEGVILIPPGAPRLVSTWTSYHNGRVPVVLSCNRQLPFWGVADSVHPQEIGRVMTRDELLAVCRLLGVHFVVWDINLTEIYCPELRGMGGAADFDPTFLPSGLIVLCDLRRIAPENPMVILGVQENLLPLDHPEGTDSD